MSGNIYREYKKVRWGLNKWMKNGRNPADPERTRFTEIAPMALKNLVIGKGRNTSDATCIPEMMKLLECMEKNDHHQYNCSAQVSLFQNCYQSHLGKVYAKKQGNVSTEPVPGEKSLTTAQLNTLLEQFPQRNDYNKNENLPKPKKNQKFIHYTIRRNK